MNVWYRHSPVQEWIFRSLGFSLQRDILYYFPLSEMLRICDSSNVAQEVRDRKKEMMFKRKLELLVVRGMMSGRRFPISVNGSRLGRAGSCEIAINDPILSRHHCLFEYVHGDLRLTDLASANGTFVNGEELCARTIVLRHNDVITVGTNTDIIVQTERNARRFFRRRFTALQSPEI